MLEILDFLITYRFDIYIGIALAAACLVFPTAASNLACASYIKAMVTQFMEWQDKDAANTGTEIEGTRKSRASIMTKKLRKQAKAARKANR